MCPVPVIGRDLHASGASLQLIVGGYIIGYAMLLVTGARLGDLHGRRRMDLAGAAGFTVSSLACGLAPTALTQIVLRFLQGASAAVMVPQIMSVIQVRFAGPDRAKALSAYGAVLSAGACSTWCSAARSSTRTWLAVPRSAVLVARDADRLLGYAMIRIADTAGSWEWGVQVGTLETLVVADSARGTGAGRELLDAARERLAEWGARVMTISSERQQRSVTSTRTMPSPAMTATVTVSPGAPKPL